MSERTIVLLAVSGVTFLLAAKAHGRQLRLERELEGYHRVVFGGSNPPFVEALWRADRVRYWTIAAALSIAVLGLFALARALGWAWPFLGGGGGSVAWLVVWGAPVAAFLTCGVWSLSRFILAISARLDGAVDSEWISESLQGSAWWFTAALLATVLVLFASTRKV
ncbi:hypothetical protein [Hyalangium versicolor]|uniref:hypothetical protein n=1 Tax=Hyalangium versicolor TaxID=2861190 RepID=UPI001CCCE0E9|nr:hypothetical protein [Hyalangium versicolor]